MYACLIYFSVICTWIWFSFDILNDIQKLKNTIFCFDFNVFTPVYILVAIYTLYDNRYFFIFFMFLVTFFCSRYRCWYSRVIV